MHLVTEVGPQKDRTNTLGAASRRCRERSPWEMGRSPEEPSTLLLHTLADSSGIPSSLRHSPKVADSGPIRILNRTCTRNVPRSHLHPFLRSLDLYNLMNAPPEKGKFDQTHANCGKWEFPTMKSVTLIVA